MCDSDSETEFLLRPGIHRKSSKCKSFFSGIFCAVWLWLSVNKNGKQKSEKRIMCQIERLKRMHYTSWV